MILLIGILGIITLFMCRRREGLFGVSSNEHVPLLEHGPNKGQKLAFVNSNLVPGPANRHLTTRDHPDPKTEFHRPALTQPLASNLPLKQPTGVLKLPQSFVYNPPVLYKLKPNENISKVIRDQGDCGSCYAFTSCEMLADRFAIKSSGKVSVDFAPQAMICDAGMFDNGIAGCNGGTPDASMEYLEKKGLALETEAPYMKDCPTDGYSCVYYGKNARAVCDHAGVTDFRSWQTDVPQDVVQKNIQAMKKEIMDHGPIFGAMVVYPSLYDYTGDKVYAHQPDEQPAGGHAVEIVGWWDPVDSEGQDDNSPRDHAHWIVRNSWGDSWPHGTSHDPGFFYILMGENECGIESGCVAIDPDFDRTPCLNDSPQDSEPIEPLTPSKKASNLYKWVLLGVLLFLIGALGYGMYKIYSKPPVPRHYGSIASWDRPITSFGGRKSSPNFYPHGKY